MTPHARGSDAAPAGADGVRVEPFAAPGLSTRIAPFALVTVLAQASLLLPGTAERSTPAIASAGVLVVVGVLVWWFSAFPSARVAVAVPVAYVGWVVLLALATNAASSGVGAIVLIPLVWTSLFHRRADSSIVVLAIVAYQVATSIIPTAAPTSVLIRRAVLWLVLGVVVSVAIHGLRDRVTAALGQRERLLAQSRTLNAVTRRLTAILDPASLKRAIADEACRLLCRGDARLGRARYFDVHGARLTGPAGAWSFGTEGAERDELTLGDLGTLGEGVTVLRPRLEHVEGDAAAIAGSLTGLPAVHTAALVPVTADERLSGILLVAWSEYEVEPDRESRCDALGAVASLAMANALAHAQLASQATSDPLTGARNRRGLEAGFGLLPRGAACALLSFDVDGLKRVNDEQGHAAGDELLNRFVGAVRGGLRPSDMLARVGGDEFVALLPGGDEHAGDEVARRIIEALQAASDDTMTVSASVGCVVRRPGESLDDLIARADEAMYAAKRSGGGTLVNA